MCRLGERERGKDSKEETHCPNHELKEAAHEKFHHKTQKNGCLLFRLFVEVAGLFPAELSVADGCLRCPDFTGFHPQQVAFHYIPFHYIISHFMSCL